MRAITASSVLAMMAATTVASAASVRAVPDEEPKAEPPAPVPTPAVRPPTAAGARLTIDEAMANTGTTAPSQALKAMNERSELYGLKRYVYMPHTGAKERAKGLRQLEKERARLAAKVAP